MPIIPIVADMAHFNPVNFTEMKAAGIVGVIHKAKQGISVKDPKYTVRMNSADELGLLTGAYDFSTHDNVAMDVADFIKYANLGSKRVAMLDFEDNTQSEMTGDMAWEWLDRVQQITGRAAVMYGGNRIREQIDHQSSKWIDMAKTVRLFQCRYIKGQPADNAALFRAVPPIAPWTGNFLIQYAADGAGPQPHTVSGLQNGADLDAFNGTPEELAAQWSGAAPGAAAPVTAAAAPSIAPSAAPAQSRTDVMMAEIKALLASHGII